MATESEQRIVASVSPRSIGGRSLFESTDAITAETVERYRSADTDIDATCRELTKLGFEVLQTGPITISIAGTQQQFEAAFGAKLRREKVRVMDGQELEFFASGQPLTAPGALQNLIEGVAIAVPPQLFESPLAPIATIDPAAYRYLAVPDDVGLVLSADRVHRMGTTGRGVKVAMVDTGFYRHPFYSWHGFSVQSTTLGPGAADPTEDTFGHGTGEAANIFATAPGITLLPVKMDSDTTGAFDKAASLSPSIITCSWGYDVDSMSWSQLKASKPDHYPYLKTLEAAVAAAVAKGIVVCFSAGNGQRGFPACHPDVIAIGGVHVNYPGLDMEASNYASSFDSKLYPGRHVPDLCGLTGRTAVINGEATAPLIMLPVQPGCELDSIQPTSGANDDGWGLFSGTSAACPQVAGVAALVLEKSPSLIPAQVKATLVKSATDVKAGSSRMGDPAGPGADKATGAGLVNAKWAFLNTMAEVLAEYLEAPPERQNLMIAAGQMPSRPREYFADLLATLRAR